MKGIGLEYFPDNDIMDSLDIDNMPTNVSLTAGGVENYHFLAPGGSVSLQI